MKKFWLALSVLLAVFLFGCGGPDIKKEVQTLNQKYSAELTDKMFLEEAKKAKDAKDWSEELAKVANESKLKFEANAKNIEAEKVSKNVDSYKNALKERNILYAHFFDLGEQQVRLKLANKPDSEIEKLVKQAEEFWDKIKQNYYEIENEYSKIMTGKPASVMGVNGVNYLAYTASNVDMAVIEGRWQTDAVGSNPYLQKKPLGMFIIIKVFVKNNQKDAITVDSNSFKLVDDQNREFSASHEALLALQAEKGESKGFLTQLNPGMGTDFTFVYDVPMELNQYNTKLVARGGFAGKKIALPISPIKITQVKQ